MRLFERLEQHTLVLVTKAANIGHQCDTSCTHGGLEVEERLQRQLVKFRRLVGKQPDLVDRQRLDPVVLPIVGVPVQRRLGQQGRGERARAGRLAEPGLPDE